MHSAFEKVMCFFDKHHMGWIIFIILSLINI